MDGIISASILGILLFLIIDWLASNEMFHIAEMKGHSDRKYFWWCFWVPLFGLAMIIALPDRKDVRQKNSEPLPETFDDLPEL